jgi:hypothetical protein
MDVSRDQEHDRIHLRDLLTCSATSLVSPVRGAESGGFSAPPENTNEGLGTSFTALQRYAIQKTSQACLKHTQAHPNPLPPAPRLRGMQKLTPPKFRAATAIPPTATRVVPGEKAPPTLQT